GTELRWCVSTRLPDEKPAARLSPTATTVVKLVCACSGKEPRTAAARPAWRKSVRGFMPRSLLEPVADGNREKLGAVAAGAVVVVAVQAFGGAVLEQQVPVGHVHVEGAHAIAEAQRDAVAVGVGQQRRHRGRRRGALVEEVAAAHRPVLAEPALQADAV